MRNRARVSGWLVVSVLLLAAGQAFGVWPTWLGHVQIVPENPTPADTVAITLSGEWYNSCRPRLSAVSITGNQIYFDAIWTYNPGVYCYSVNTLWGLTESVGPQAAGTYDVYARIIASGDPPPDFYPPDYSLVAQITVSLPSNTWYVNAAAGSDTNNGTTPETAFATIQKGIDMSVDGDSVLVFPGVYTEAISFDGKAITVSGTEGAATIEAPGDYAVSFFNAEGPQSVLKHFVITNSMGIFVSGGSPTINHLTIVGNEFGIAAYSGAEPDINNCIFWNNLNGNLFQCTAKNSLNVGGSLISYWRLDGNATDSAGENHGTMFGTTGATGFVGGALSFDGINDYISIGDKDNLDFGQRDSFTVMAWIKTSLWNSAVISKRRFNAGGYGLEGYQFRVFQDKLYFAIEDINGSYTEAFGTRIITDNLWHHLVAVRDTSMDTVTLYVDGTPDGLPITDVTMATLATTESLEIGRAPHYGIYFSGLIDEAAIYNKALSAAEIGQLYQNSLSGLGYDQLSVEAEPVDPCFADEANGDFHLKSTRGRYWPEHNVWIADDTDSPAINAGDPAENPAIEPKPNGWQVNMGAYGGTPQASKGDWKVLGDANGDGRINIIDLATLKKNWLKMAPWAN